MIAKIFLFVNNYFKNFMAVFFAAIKLNSRKVKIGNERF